MRILFTGGGTGGHIFPLIVVKRKIELMLKSNFRKIDFEFLGSGSVEKDIFLKEKIATRKLIGVKWRRYFSIKNFVDILKLPIVLFQAFYNVWAYMPDIIFSKGGPGSFFVVIAGWLYRIPIVIHESDSVPGITNKLSSPFSKKIAISFEEAKKFFPKRKTVLTGTPIRQKVLLGSKEKAKEIFKLTGDRKIIFIMGGSQGAKEINSIFVDVINKYIEKYEILHMCGEKNFKDLNLLTKGILREKQRTFYHLLPFLNEEEMGHAYAAADVVLARAGSGTIFEIAATEKPSVIVPLKKGAQDHQAKNAYNFTKTGAGTVIEETNITPNFVFGRVSQVASSEKNSKRMKEACRKFARPNAASEVAKIIINIA